MSSDCNTNKRVKRMIAIQLGTLGAKFLERVRLLQSGRLVVGDNNAVLAVVLWRDYCRVPVGLDASALAASASAI